MAQRELVLCGRPRFFIGGALYLCTFSYIDVKLLENSKEFQKTIGVEQTMLNTRAVSASEYICVVGGREFICEAFGNILSARSTCIFARNERSSKIINLQIN